MKSNFPLFHANREIPTMYPARFIFKKTIYDMLDRLKAIDIRQFRGELFYRSKAKICQDATSVMNFAFEVSLSFLDLNRSLSSAEF